jgi:hypothetical protein
MIDRLVRADGMIDDHQSPAARPHFGSVAHSALQSELPLRPAADPKQK